MKNSKLIVFFLVVLLVNCVHEASAQSQWVIGGMLPGPICPGPATIRVYNTSGTLLAFGNIPTFNGTTDTPVYGEALISLPANVDLNQLRLTAQANCEQEFDLSSFQPLSNTAATWFQIVPGGFNGCANGGCWEFVGQLYKFTTPVVSGCDVVNFELPTHISNVFPGELGFSEPLVSHVSWKITDGASTITLDTYGADGISISTSQMQSWFGSSFSLSKPYTMTATDENLPPHTPVTFRMKSAPPQVNFNPVPKYCNPTGLLNITGGTIFAPSATVTVTGTSGSSYNGGWPVSNASVGSFSVPAGPDTYHIQVQNDYSDSGDNCYTSYTVNVPDGFYSLNVTEQGQSNVTCHGGSNGSITLNNVTGGNGPLNYTWTGPTGGQTTQNISGLPQGTYGVTVKDANQCTGSIGGIGITEPAALSAPTATVTSGSLANHNGSAISCAGASDGRITFDIPTSGGSGNYHYSIDGGSSYQSSNVFSNLTAATYAIRIRDANDFSCTQAGSSKTISNPTTVVAGVASTSCSGASNNVVTITGSSGGTASLNYVWRDQSSNVVGATATVSNLAPGTYSVTVADANGCSASGGSVVVNPPITAPITQTSFINCNGQTTAAFNTTASGGTSTYSYSWSPGPNVTSAVSNVGAGTYTVTVTDGNGCQIISPITVNEPTQLTAIPTPSNFNSFNISCKGGNDGSINLAVGGGTPGTSPPYTYSWSTGASTQNVSGLSKGSYSVIVTDSKGCPATASITMAEPPTAVSVSLQTKNDVTCFGANNGGITVSGTGGVGAFSYSKDGTTYQPSNSFIALPSGSYTVTAKDANSCTANTSSITITSPVALSITSIAKTNPSCFGASTGSLQVTATGGTTPYQYSIDGVNYFSTSTFSSLASGSYIVTVRDANSCSTSSTSQALTDPVQITASNTTTSQSCSANTDGKITVSASGGTGALTYSINGTTFQTSQVFTSLVAGAYTVTIKDANNCSKTIPATVGIVTALSSTLTQTAFINCNGEPTAALSLTPSGGTTPYTYSWSTGSTAQNLSGLTAGSYSVVITDSKNCSTNKNITVTQPAVLSLSQTSSNYNGFEVSCATSIDGFINLTVNGGSSPYTYAWSNGETSKNISALAAGSYTVTVTDSKSCTANLTQLLSAPTLLTLASSKTDVTCNGGNDGSLTATASGGVGSYQYTIDGGSTWLTSGIFSSQFAGGFTIQTKDQNNCTASTSATIAQPTLIVITIGTIQDAACGQTNGSVQASATGGTGALSYSWRNSSNQVVGTSATLSDVSSGTYALTVIDQNSCSKTASASISNPNGPVFTIINQIGATCSNSTDGQAMVSITGVSPFSVSWGNGETGITATKLIGGINTVTVTDGGNCLTTQNFTVAAPTAITLSSVQNTIPTCPAGVDGSIQTTPTGGTAPYSYKWNGINGSNNLTGVGAGDYDVQVTDASNCVLNQTINLAGVPAIVIAVVNQVAPTCSNNTDGSLIVQATGGNGTFNYSWNTGAMVAQLNSIGGGDYIVTAKDSKNCTQQKTITMIAPAAITATLTPTSVMCHGGNDGAIQISASGGTGTYSYSNNNGSTWQTQSSILGLIAGDYTIQTKDQNGCNAFSPTTVTEPTVLAINTTKTDPTCNQANGLAQVTASGGTGSYVYQWTNSLNQTQSTTVNLQNAFPDTYTITVTDVNSCTTIGTVIMNSYASAQLTITNISSVTCSYSKDASATLQITSGQAPYTQVWTSGETTTTATKLAAGQNTITVIDANGCSVTKAFQVPSPLALTAVVETVINPICAGGSDGSVQVIATGGTGTLSYTWNGTAGSNAIQNVKAGTYNLIIKDGNNCQFTKSYSITDPALFTIDLGPDVTICPKATTQIGLTLPNATYQWSGPSGFTSTAGTVNVNAPGTYQLTLINALGCQASDDVAITIANNLLKADFLTVSEAVVGDTIIVIDISWPIPDYVSWYLGDSATVFHADNDYALISYSEPGTYRVGVKATMSGCTDEYYQHITVSKEKVNKGGRESAEASISSFVVYPNPFEGKTNVDITLSEPGSATIKVYCLSTNLMIVSHQFDGEKNYQVELDLNGREAGVYIIVLQAGATTKSVKVIKL